ncbi:MAG: type III pantothenate kinase [Clostridiales bacterium]|jgi:type III pantothenate kinase|nr:type III pantothenate kinase [Clostridiales bacterium]
MLLAFDIGNTNIKTGLFENGVLQHSFRLSVDRTRTADEYGIQVESFFHHLHLSPSIIDSIIISSVVPPLNYTIAHMCAMYFSDIDPMFVHAGLRTDLLFSYENPQTLGPDRICNSVAAMRLYGGNSITIDFGTATTFNVLRGNRFLGGMICPGFKVSSNALIESTAMLPKVEFVNPGDAIGANTEHCIQSGLFFGYVGQVEYLVDLAKKALGESATVIATGGMVELILTQTTCIDIINPMLTLAGLGAIYELNNHNE